MRISTHAYDPSGPAGHLPIEDDGEEIVQIARVASASHARVAWSTSGPTVSRTRR
jgi:hypothetical protein